MAKKAIRFLYMDRGIDQEFEVIKPYSRGWLCRVVRGPLLDDELVFDWETIRFGQVRLSVLNKKYKLTTCG